MRKIFSVLLSKESGNAKVIDGKILKKSISQCSKMRYWWRLPSEKVKKRGGKLFEILLSDFFYCCLVFFHYEKKRSNNVQFNRIKLKRNAW